MARELVKEIPSIKKNYILNSNFSLWQRSTANQVFGASISYHADRFSWAAGTITGQVTSEKRAKTDYSNSTIIPAVCDDIQRYTVSTAQAVLSAGSTAGPWYKLEGSDLEDLLHNGGIQRGINLSFYVASSVTGTYTIEFINSGLDNRYYTTYTINTANTWQRVSINLTASELITGTSSGTWNYANGIGLYIRFWLACGTSAQGGTQNQWTGSTPNVSPAQVNLLSTLSNTWGITGIMLTDGNVAPTFVTRGESFADELRLCQRYYEKSYNVDINPGTNTFAGCFLGYLPSAITAGSAWSTNVPFKVPKRDTPSVLTYSIGGSVQTTSIGGTPLNTITSRTGTTGFTPINNTGSSQGSLGISIEGHFIADAEL
jgi:hypothetical protein